MEELRRMIFEAIGEASMCWSETPKGTFDSEHASKVGNGLYQDILRWIDNKGYIDAIESREVKEGDKV